MKKLLALALLASFGLTACAHNAAAPVKPEHVYRVYFNTNETRLDNGDQKQILAAAKAFKDGGQQVILAGHADRVGSKLVNDKLSQARAVSVTAALVTAGVPRELINTRYYGDEAAIKLAKEKAGTASKTSRRVTIIVR